METIKCPKCNEDGYLTIDFVSSGYPILNNDGQILWDFDEYPEPVYNTIICTFCGDDEISEDEVIEYNSYCECGNSKMENSNFCKDCI